MNRAIAYILLSGILIVNFSCVRKLVNFTSKNHSSLLYLSDGIEIGDVTKLNVDTAKLSKLSNDLILGKFQNIHSVLIWRNNKLFFEKYLSGKDLKHGKNLGIVNHSEVSLHDTRSISKSFVSLCVGIAIEKGFIKNVNDPISLYLPEYKIKHQSGTQNNEITIKHLLTMSSGLQWNEIENYDKLFNDEMKMDLSFNPVKFILKKNSDTVPGIFWNYSAGNTQLLAEIIKRTSGQDIKQFARAYVFSPLLISNDEWVNLTFKKTPSAGSGLRLSSRSLLKFGMLYENSGRFNNKQIVDSTWIKMSLTSQISRPNLKKLNIDNGSYGFQFWLYEYSKNGRLYKIIEAKGNGGQSVFICKELHLVAVITAGNYSNIMYNDLTNTIFKNYILSAMI